MKKPQIAVNQAALSATTGKSDAVINAARNHGCPAFDPSGRINVDVFLAWMVEHPELDPDKEFDDLALKFIGDNVRQSHLYISKSLPGIVAGAAKGMKLTRRQCDTLTLRLWLMISANMAGQIAGSMEIKTVLSVPDEIKEVGIRAKMEFGDTMEF